ncbi:MAG: DUF456 domain-containing protein [Pirellulaceae bacterium]|nr:DUF456 domain-containing protein [Pirellulaceae bacterium]
MVLEVVVVIAAVVLILLQIACWILSVLGLPGNWLIILLASIFSYFAPDEHRADFDWQVILLLCVVAIFGEGLELLAGAMGAAKQGGSKRGAILSLLGSLVGGLAGIFLGTFIPLPLFGQLAGALLGASVGALGGSILGERWKGKELEESWKIGKAAFWGRLFGTLGKVMVGGIMIAVTIAATLIA